MLEVEKH